MPLVPKPGFAITGSVYRRKDGLDWAGSAAPCNAPGEPSFEVRLGRSVSCCLRAIVFGVMDVSLIRSAEPYLD